MSDQSALIAQLTDCLIAANGMALAGHDVIVKQEAEIERLRAVLQALVDATELPGEDADFFDWLNNLAPVRAAAVALLAGEPS